VGGVILRGADATTVPPRNGRTHLLSLLERIMATPRTDGSGAARLDVALRRVGSMARRRGLVVVVSDFATDPEQWSPALGIAALRHSVLCIEVLDPRDLELPDVGPIELLDPATGEVREVNTASTRVRQEYAAAAAAQRELIRGTIRGAGANHLELRTDRDWLMDLARYVSRKRQRAEVLAGRAQR
jgi:uncharacterized protein (DUF58 family)